MREYQVSYRGSRFVTRDNIIQVLNELGYNPGTGDGQGGYIQLKRIVRWYLASTQDSGVTVPRTQEEMQQQGWVDYFVKPTLDYQYTWKFSEYQYVNSNDPDHIILTVATDPEIISIYSSSGGGMGVEFSYSLFDKEVTSVTINPVGSNNGPTPNTIPEGDWTDDLDSLDYTSDGYLWMSSRKIDGQIDGNWKKPIRLSGEDGSAGADGIDIEFIYKRSGRKPVNPDDIPGENDKTQDNFVPSHPEGWEDNPQGVEDNGEYRYEWMCYRTRTDDPIYKWSDWSDVYIWAAFGEKGMDGDGVEYIYMNTHTPTVADPNPPTPDGPRFKYNGNSFTDWTGNVYEESTNVWKPKGWNAGLFNEWIGGYYNDQGEWIPKIDRNGSNDPSNFWSDSPKGVGENNKFEWVSSRKRVNEEWGPFSPPKIWSTFSKEHTIEIVWDEETQRWVWKIDGVVTDKPAEGEPGKGIDLKGRVKFYSNDDKASYIQAHPDEADNPELTTLEDVVFPPAEDASHIGDCYVVEDNGHIYLYIGGSDPDWERHWQNFGEFQGEGSYVHIAWANQITFLADHVTVDQAIDFVLDRDASGGIEYNWMGICTNHEKNDPGYPRRNEYKWNHVRGKDGDNIERVYMRTGIEERPIIDTSYPDYSVELEDETIETVTYQDREYLPFLLNPVNDPSADPPLTGCAPDEGTFAGLDDGGHRRYQFTDDPQGISSTLPYEWMAERKKVDGVWEGFSKATLWATYSSDGQSVVRSTVFKRSAEMPDPPIGGDFESPVPEDQDWFDGLPPVEEGVEPLPIWMSSRIFTSDEQPPQGNWTDPVLLQDSKYLDIELSNWPRSSIPADPSPNNQHGCEELDEDNVQIWFDPGDDAEYIEDNYDTFNWMATRNRFINADGEPDWRPWTKVLIKGEDGATGASGRSIQHAYVSVPNSIEILTIDNVSTGDNAPISTVNNTAYEWSLSTNDVVVGPEEALWMSERTIEDSQAGTWSDPVKISGNGSPGEDAEDIEFIYHRSNNLPNNDVGSLDVPSTIQSSNGKTYDQDDFIPIGWTDNPQGVGYFTESDVEVFYKYEWMCQRVKPRSNQIVDPSNPWGPWSRIFVWSAYGDSGMDGDGIEYVYTRNSTTAGSVPNSPRAIGSSGNIEWKWDVKYKNGAWIPKDWETHTSGIGNFDHWDAERGEYNPQGEWIPIGWTDNPQGVGYFTRLDEHGDPVLDENDDPVKDLYECEWVSSRKKVNGEWKAFSNPTIWTNYSTPPSITVGADGYWYIDGHKTDYVAEGPQGQGIQLKDTVEYYDAADRQAYLQEHGEDISPIYTFLEDIDPTDASNNGKYDDIAPGDCYVVKSSRFLYVCVSDKAHWNSPAYESWEDHWDEIGEFQGAPGESSYMHIAWATSDKVKFDEHGEHIIRVEAYETWYENRNSDLEYDWMGICTDGNKQDPPSNWGTETYDITNEETWNWKKYKWNHSKGKDGDNYERVYIKTKIESAPGLNQNSYDGEHGDKTKDEFLPLVVGYDSSLSEDEQPYSNYRFTDDPSGVSSTWPYEWVAERRKKKDPEDNNIVKWFNFSNPSLWAKYSFNGQPGASVEVRYISVPREIEEVSVDDVTADNPTFTYTDENEDNTIYSWVEGTSTLDIDSEHLLWMIQRTVQGNYKTDWCDPIRLTGEDGEPGADGRNIEFIFKRSNSIPSANDAPTLNKQTPGYIPNWTQSDPQAYHVDQNTGWEDHPLGVGNATVGGQQVFYKYEWMCQRIKPAGTGQNWQNWVGPFVWSAYGDTGMDGDGIEYVFYLGDEPASKPKGPTAKIKNSENLQPWDGGVYLKSGVTGTPQSDDWLPKNWPTSTYGEWNGWYSNYGKYNPQGEWIPKVVVGTNSADSNFWTDDPKGVDKDNQEEWVSLRKRTEGKWGTFSDPALWASWGTKVKIEDGWWYVNGYPTGYRAEGKDGKGIALKGSVDFRSNFDKDHYVSENNISEVEAAKLTTLEEIRPRESNTYTIEIGDCYVVKDNRYLYACIHNEEVYDSEDNPLGWIENDGYGTDNWDWTKNWDEIGEFQGKGSYMHIAWATDSAVHFDDEGKIEYVAPFIHKYEELDRDVVYDWMGVCTDEFEDDPIDNCDPETGDITDESDVANWSLYAWNHVKGKDGSDYERVYVKTKTENAPAVIQTAYEDNVIHRDPSLDEFFPQVAEYDEDEHSSPTFTDDPTGVSPTWPYEWVTERKKKLDPTDQKIKWQEFYSPAKLWAVYSFDGLSAHTTKSSETIFVDSAGNIVGGLGDVDSDNPQNPKLYTEVQIYDPTSGSYLNYNTGNTPATDGFVITGHTGTNCTALVNSSGKIYVKSITSLSASECSIEIVAKIHNNRTFRFNYTVTISHLPRTYLSYSLTNDSDMFTYRTRTGQYDGLPIETCLKVQTTDGAVDELNDNTTKTAGYISKVTIKAKEFRDSNDNIINNLLQYAKTYIGTATNSLTTVSDKTFYITPSISGNNVTHRTRTAIIYKDSNYQQDTGLRLEVKSDGNVKLYRTGSSNIDLVDAKHDLIISCTAIVGGVTYTGPEKVFSLSEKNDATLYRLQLNFDTVIEDEDGNFDPNVPPTVKVNIIDGTGSTSVNPTDTKLSSKHIFVRYVKGPSSTPGSDTLYDTCPSYSNIVSNSEYNRMLTVVIVEYDSTNTTPLIYHDSETVDIVPPGTPGSSQTFLDINTDRIIIDCDEDGYILGSERILRKIRAQLKWGDELCLEDSLDKDECSMTAEGFDYIFSTNNNTTKACQIKKGWADDDNEDNNIYGADLYFNPGKVLYSGTIVVYMEGTFSDGVTRHASKTVVIEGKWRGPEGEKGDYKAIAFTRTNDDISGLNPTGGNYSTQAWPNPTTVGSTTYRWSDGIPDGDAMIWACTHTFLGVGESNITWSNPRCMKDTPNYDVEFAYRQENDATPATPAPNNRHGCKELNQNNVQIWFDPDKDRNMPNTNPVVPRDFTQMYWRAEKEINNGDDSGPWVISRIRGEGVPSVRLDPNYDLISIEVGPTGILASETIFYINSYIYVGDSLQYISSSEDNNEVALCTASLKTTNSNITIQKSAWSSGGVKWTITFAGNKTYSTNNEITFTLKNSTYTVSRTISIVFTRKNQSKIKSFVFKRFATPALAAAGTPSGGTFNSPTPNPANGWTDGIPNDGTSNPIYMSHRTFTSDGTNQTNWTAPSLMSDSDNFNVEFSPSDTNPGAPVAGTSGNMHGCSPATNQVWYDPTQDSEYFNAHAEDMIWMATSTSKDSSGNWVNWAVVKIKGESGESQHVQSCKAYYQAFNTLTVTIPSAGTEGSWTSTNTLIGAGWTDAQIEPTQDNPYLWRFFRTVYENPERVEHYGLEMIQVWAEKMINPNLLDDTDFIDDNHLGGWYRTATNNTYFGDSEGHERTQYETLTGSGTSSNYGSNPKQYYLQYSTPSSGVTTTDYVGFLEQKIYDESFSIKKLSSNTWYTLYFEAFAKSRTTSGGTDKLTIFISDSISGDIIWTEKINTTVSTTIGGSSFETKFGYQGSSYGQWNKITATFKTGTLSSSSKVRIEFRVKPQAGRTQKIYIRKPKLEIGQVATDYVSSTSIRDPYPRLTTWDEGKQYYQGQLGEPYLDAVTLGGNSWFRCRTTHLSTASNKPVMGQTTLYWEPANKLDFIVTDLLLAETGYIKNLVVGGLRTGRLGEPHVEMEGSSVKFYGNLSFPSIVLDTDNDGVGILNFYDKNGSLLYNLGPGGLVYYSSQESGWINTGVIKMKAFTSSQLNQTGPGLGFLACYESELDQYYLWKEGFTVVENANGTRIFTYNIGELNSSTGKRDRSKPSEYNNKYYKNMNEGTIEVTPTIGNSFTTACPSGNFLSGWYIYRNDGHYDSGGETIDTGDGNLRLSNVIAYNYIDGQLAKSTTVYFQSISGYWMNSLGQSKGGFGSGTTFGYFLDHYNG